MSRTSAALALLASLALGLAPRGADACGACRGAGGAGGALTAGDERWSLALALLGRQEIGTWDSSGRAHGEPAGVQMRDATAQLEVGVRPVRPLELALFGGAGAYAFAAPGLTSSGAALTDVTGRARLDLAAEDPTDPARFASAAWLAVRAPTGNDGQGAGGTAAALGQFGLGAWEFAVGADLRRTFATRWQPFAAIEGALRTPGADLSLGPRISARAGLTVFLNDLLALSALAEWDAEGDRWSMGNPVERSWQERTSAVLAASLHGPGAFRGALSVATDLPVDALGRNADATVRVGLTVGFAAVEPAWRACPVRTPPPTLALLHTPSAATARGGSVW